jgi:uncharacterized protein (TIGR02001 family)
MLKNKLLVAALASAFAMPVLAEDAPAPSPVTGNVAFVSDYVFNGISQNYRTPALQGGFDYVNPNGLYLGTWASNVSGNQYSNASMELDLYGGYNGKVNDDLGYQIGLMEVVYPGGKAFNATVTNNVIPGPSKKWDTTEFILGATFKGVNIKYTRTLTDWYGINTDGFTPAMWAAGDTAVATGASTANSAAANSKGSGYLEANYTYTFAGDVALALHAGHQKINNFSLLSYTDYKIGISKPVGGFTLGAAYTTTNATDNTLYHVKLNGDDKKLGGGILALSVSRSL